MTNDVETVLRRIMEADERVVLLTCGVAADALIQTFSARVYQCLRGEQTAMLAALALSAEGFRSIVLVEASSVSGRGGALLDAFTREKPNVCCLCVGASPPDFMLPRTGRTTASTDSERLTQVLEAWVRDGGTCTLAVV